MGVYIQTVESRIAWMYACLNSNVESRIVWMYGCLYSNVESRIVWMYSVRNIASTH
jgi:hypothetical protein